MEEVRTGYPHELGAVDPFARQTRARPECPVCSGKVRRDDDAVEAVRWGLLDARAGPYGAAMWKSAIVAHHVRGVGRSASTASLSDGLGAYSCVAEGAPMPESYTMDVLGQDRDPLAPSSAALWADFTLPTTPEEWAEMWELGELLKRRKLIPEDGVGIAYSSHLRCCVKDLKYPKGGIKFEFVKDVMDAEGAEDSAMVRIVYDVEAEFIEGFQEGVYCHCPCCEFRQYIIDNYVDHHTWDYYPDGIGEHPPGWYPGTYPGPHDQREDRGSGKEGDPAQLDCFWVVTDSDGRRAQRTGGASESSVATEEGDTIVSGPHCAGSRDTSVSFPHPETPGGDVRGDYSEDGCKFAWQDTPEQQVFVGKQFDWRWHSASIIHDVCHKNAIRAYAEIDEVFSGVVPSGANELRTLDFAGPGPKPVGRPPGGVKAD